MKLTKNFRLNILYGTFENLRFEMFSETSTWSYRLEVDHFLVSESIYLKITLSEDYPNSSPEIEVPARSKVMSAAEISVLVSHLQEVVNIIFCLNLSCIC